MQPDDTAQPLGCLPNYSPFGDAASSGRQLFLASWILVIKGGALKPRWLQYSALGAVDTANATINFGISPTMRDLAQPGPHYPVLFTPILRKGKEKLAVFVLAAEVAPKHMVWCPIIALLERSCAHVTGLVEYLNQLPKTERNPSCSFYMDGMYAFMMQFPQSFEEHLSAPRQRIIQEDAAQLEAVADGKVESMARFTQTVCGTGVASRPVTRSQSRAPPPGAAPHPVASRPQQPLLVAPGPFVAVPVRMSLLEAIDDMAARLAPGTPGQQLILGPPVDRQQPREGTYIYPEPLPNDADIKVEPDLDTHACVGRMAYMLGNIFQGIFLCNPYEGTSGAIPPSEKVQWVKDMDRPVHAADGETSYPFHTSQLLTSEGKKRWRNPQRYPKNEDEERPPVADDWYPSMFIAQPISGAGAIYVKFGMDLDSVGFSQFMALVRTVFALGTDRLKTTPSLGLADGNTMFNVGLKIESINIPTLDKIGCSDVAAFMLNSSMSDLADSAGIQKGDLQPILRDHFQQETYLYMLQQHHRLKLGECEYLKDGAPWDRVAYAARAGAEHAAPIMQQRLESAMHMGVLPGGPGAMPPVGADLKMYAWMGVDFNLVSADASASPPYSFRMPAARLMINGEHCAYTTVFLYDVRKHLQSNDSASCTKYGFLSCERMGTFFYCRAWTPSTYEANFQDRMRMTALTDISTDQSMQGMASFSEEQWVRAMEVPGLVMTMQCLGYLGNPVQWITYNSFTGHRLRTSRVEPSMVNDVVAAIELASAFKTEASIARCKKSAEVVIQAVDKVFKHVSPYGDGARSELGVQLTIGREGIGSALKHAAEEFLMRTLSLRRKARSLMGCHVTASWHAYIRAWIVQWGALVEAVARAGLTISNQTARELAGMAYAFNFMMDGKQFQGLDLPMLKAMKNIMTTHGLFRVDIAWLKELAMASLNPKPTHLPASPLQFEQAAQVDRLMRHCRGIMDCFDKILHPQPRLFPVDTAILREAAATIFHDPMRSFGSAFSVPITAEQSMLLLGELLLNHLPIEILAASNQLTVLTLSYFRGMTKGARELPRNVQLYSAEWIYGLKNGAAMGKETLWAMEGKPHAPGLLVRMQRAVTFLPIADDAGMGGMRGGLRMAALGEEVAKVASAFHKQNSAQNSAQNSTQNSAAAPPKHPAIQEERNSSKALVIIELVK